MTQSDTIIAHLLNREGRPNSIVRQASAADLPAIVAIHKKAFRQFFLSRMGSEFLLRYYELVLDYPQGIVLVGEGHGQLKGFACGFADPKEFYRVMRRSTHTFALPAVRAVIRNPSLITGIARGIRRIQEAALQRPAQSCELSSIAVTPEAGGTGLGATLAHAFLSQAWAMKAKCVRLCTDAEGNEAVNAFYRKIGFRQSRRYLQQRGRWMNEYVIDCVKEADDCENLR